MKALKKFLIAILILLNLNIVAYPIYFNVVEANENEIVEENEEEEYVDLSESFEDLNNETEVISEDDNYENYSEAYKKYLKLSDEEKAKVYVIPDKYDMSLDEFNDIYGKS